MENTEFKDKLVSINRITKVVKGGRRFAFSALVVVGNQVQSSEKIIQDATQTKILSRIPNVDKIENNWVESQGKILKQNLMEYIPV